MFVSFCTLLIGRSAGKDCHRVQTDASERSSRPGLTNVKADPPETGASWLENRARIVFNPGGQLVPIRKLRKIEWRPYLDRVGRAVLGKRAAIEIRSPEFSNEVEAEWLPLLGISYDSKKDILEVAVTGLKHMVRKPQHMVVEESGDQLATLEIIDENGLSQIVRLREELEHAIAIAAPQRTSG
jgi:hypothetical protein